MSTKYLVLRDIILKTNNYDLLLEDMCPLALVVRNSSIKGWHHSRTQGYVIFSKIQNNRWDFGSNISHIKNRWSSTPFWSC
jgi:hypothetical protein